MKKTNKKLIDLDALKADLKIIEQKLFNTLEYVQALKEFFEKVGESENE